MKDSELVQWDDSFSVQFKKIDDQHKELVRMTNQLLTGCKKGRGAADASFMKTIQNAVNYARTHFSTEEKYMEQVSYPEYAIHKKEHEGFVAEVLNQLKSFEDGSSEPIAFARFLKNWLLNHIAVSDKKYAPFLTAIAD